MVPIVGFACLGWGFHLKRPRLSLYHLERREKSGPRIKVKLTTQLSSFFVFIPVVARGEDGLGVVGFAANLYPAFTATSEQGVHGIHTYAL